ncbi:MAG: hypothetical protein AB7Q69_13895 [Gemmatimonadales bacterium]
MTKPGAVSWQTLGGVSPTALTAARLQSHHAVQVVVSLGISYLPPRPDDSHTNLGWLPEQEALVSREVPAGRPFRGALRLRDLTLLLLDQSGAPWSTLPLAGHTAREALAWLAAGVADAGGDPTSLRAGKHYDIPAHPIGSGAAFSAEPAWSFEELARYYDDAHTLLTSLARRTPGASEVRCWPHHFDLGTLITLSGSGEAARTIGLGMSPGDASYGEPYFYVTPWPSPPDRRGPGLPAGHWHTAEWFGAVLTGTELMSARDTDGQMEQVSAFLSAATETCRTLLA